MANIEWTMNDLLQLKTPRARKSIHENSPGVDNCGNAGKKTINQHKRPSISYEINSKRAKGHDATIKPTPQLLQQLIAVTSSTNCSKIRPKIAVQNIKSENRWTPPQSSLFVEEKQLKKPTATSSVLMNLLVSGCDVSAGYSCLPRSKVAKA